MVVADQNEAQVAVLEGHGTCIVCLIIHALLLLLGSSSATLLLLHTANNNGSRNRRLKNAPITASASTHGDSAPILASQHPSRCNAEQRDTISIITNSYTPLLRAV
ncbi:uncharacterized protein TrAFT101_003142 [Trichoderma asperellum]|uniref:uncharacterized protein n=1 Tax=Trichoderma asperellum TaxID=101201 RepID=UPI0033209F7D|nr:hypothetical protein TrAFT101_003142 [Trichoderma asperellum]